MDAYWSAVKWKNAHDDAKRKLGEDIAAQQHQIDSYMKKLTALSCELQTKTSENDVLKLKNDTLTREKARLQSSINLANMSPPPRPSSTFAVFDPFRPLLLCFINASLALCHETDLRHSAACFDDRKFFTVRSSALRQRFVRIALVIPCHLP